jgi:hypothetical protein
MSLVLHPPALVLNPYALVLNPSPLVLNRSALVLSDSHLSPLDQGSINRLTGIFFDSNGRGGPAIPSCPGAVTSTTDHPAGSPSRIRDIL